jgi:tetratricopeptide (TPR) repeat protein
MKNFIFAGVGFGIILLVLTALSAPMSQNETLSAAQYFDRAIQLDRAGDLEGAILAYDEAIKLDPNLEVALANRANAHHRAGNQELAIDDANRALLLDPRDAVAFMAKAHAQHHLGDFAGAIVTIDQALKNCPNERAEFLKARGHMNSKLGRHKLAINDTEAALEMDPSDPELYCNMAIFYARLNDRTAMRYLESGHELAPRHPCVRKLWGTLRFADNIEKGE